MKKKNISFLLFSFLLFSSTVCSAQSKFGHVNYVEVLNNMHGIDSIQNIVQEYRTELQTIGEQMQKEFQEKFEAFEKLSNTPGTSPAILKIRQDDLAAMYKRIQEFGQSAEIDLRDKQMELWEPFDIKLKEAIKKIAKVNQYNYIFDVNTLLFQSPVDDLTDKVKAELGIK
jgi:Skp family chaperone for outer membrane proteins